VWHRILTSLVRDRSACEFALRKIGFSSNILQKKQQARTFSGHRATPLPLANLSCVALLSIRTFLSQIEHNLQISEAIHNFGRMLCCRLVSAGSHRIVTFRTLAGSMSAQASVPALFSL